MQQYRFPPYSKYNLIEKMDSFSAWQSQVKFSFNSPALSLNDSTKGYSRILNEGYFDEIEDRLKELNLQSDVYINPSSVYSEALSGKRYRIVLIGVSCNISEIDKEEIEYILQDVIDDFPELELKINWTN